MKVDMKFIILENTDPKTSKQIQWCSPNSNCSNSNIALLASYFSSPSEYLMLVLFL